MAKQVDLDLTNTGLLRLPQEIEFLRFLKKLNISENKLETLENLPACVETLVATKNRLISLRGLERARFAAVDNNRIADISDFANMKAIVEIDASNNRIDYIDKYDVENNASLSLLNLANNPVAEELHSDPATAQVVFFNLPAEIMPGMYCKSLAYFRRSFVYMHIRDYYDSRLTVSGHLDQGAADHDLEDMEDDSFLQVIDSHVRLTQNDPQTENQARASAFEKPRQSLIVHGEKKALEQVSSKSYSKMPGVFSVKGSTVSDPFFMEERQKQQAPETGRREFILTGEEESLLLVQNSENGNVEKAAWTHLDKFMEIYGILFPTDPYPQSKRIVFDSAVSNFANKVVDLIAQTESDSKLLLEKDARNEELLIELEKTKKRLEFLESQLNEPKPHQNYHFSNNLIKSPSGGGGDLLLNPQVHHRSRTREIIRLDEDTIVIDTTSNLKTVDSSRSKKDRSRKGQTATAIKSTGIDMKRFGSVQYQSPLLKTFELSNKKVNLLKQSPKSSTREKYWKRPGELWCH